MSLPPYLKENLSELLDQQPLGKISQASLELSQLYRGTGTKAMLTKPQRAAYLAVRLPATFEAVSSALGQTLNQIPQENIKSLLDLGAGPGTASHAAAALLPSLEEATLMERDGELINMGQKLARKAPFKTTWKQADLSSYQIEKSYDLIIISYLLNEMKSQAALRLVEQAWDKTRLLLVVEPGTPAGFSTILKCRDWLLHNSAQMLAPCPHQLACPLALLNDWCHFAARVERSKEHRLSKQAELGYEDEKFSYIAAGKETIALPSARLVRHPEKHSGHMQLTLCQEGKIIKQTYSKKQGAIYKAAKKLQWGDAWDELAEKNCD